MSERQAKATIPTDERWAALAKVNDAATMGDMRQWVTWYHANKEEIDKAENDGDNTSTDSTG